MVNERQELETFWYTSPLPAERQPFFLSLSLSLVLFSLSSFPPCSSASSFFSLAHTPWHGNSRGGRIGISSRGYLSIEEVFRPRRFAIVRNATRLCYSQVQTRAPTWKLSLSGLFVLRFASYVRSIFYENCRITFRLIFFAKDTSRYFDIFFNSRKSASLMSADQKISACAYSWRSSNTLFPRSLYITSKNYVYRSSKGRAYPTGFIDPTRPTNDKRPEGSQRRFYESYRQRVAGRKTRDVAAE